MVSLDMVQQLVRIIMQFVGGTLVARGVLTEEVAAQLAGAVLSLSGVAWWLIWNRKRTV